MGSQPEASRWPLLVVVLNELLRDVLEVLLTEDEELVQHLAPAVPTQRSEYAFARDSGRAA
jgi:hypothetical protein